MIDRNEEPRDDESRGSFVGKNRACSVSDFFKGWRRKAGLVTLTMACLLAVGWMRSILYWDMIYFSQLPGTGHDLVSERGLLGWERMTFPIEEDSSYPMVKWESDPNSRTGEALNFAYLESTSDESFVWRRCYGGFSIGETSGVGILPPFSFDKDDLPFTPMRYVIVPYWSLVLPLTLLSAWLILVEPRKAKAATGSTP